MEREPRKHFTIEIGNHRLVCTPENTYGYLYEDTRYDHIFYVKNRDDDGNMLGFHIWRPMLGDEQFDDTVRHMITNGYDVESLTEPDDNDKNAFHSKYKNEPEEPPKLIEPVELTPRQEAFCENYGKFLQYIDVTVEDFYGTRAA